MVLYPYMKVTLSRLTNNKNLCQWWWWLLRYDNALTGIAYQLHRVAVGRRWHPGVQDHEDAKGAEAA